MLLSWDCGSLVKSGPSLRLVADPGVSPISEEPIDILKIPGVEKSSRSLIAILEARHGYSLFAGGL